MQTSLLKMSSVFFLFFCVQIQFTEAQIIYTDVMPDTIFSTSGKKVSVDLNKDGMIDFDLTITSKNATSFGCTGSRINNYLRVTPAGTNNAILNNSNLPSALALNSSIDSSSQLWKQNVSQIMAADTFRCTSGRGGLGWPPRGGVPGWINAGSGNFRNTTNKYLAVRFYAGKQLFYGWIRFSVTSNLTVTLKDYAYQSNGTPSLLAGQTSDDYIATSVSNVSQLCAGASFNAGYLIFGNFNPANVVSVELSDSIGNFTKGTIIGSMMSNISGSISCIIPKSLSGTGYRYRVISSNPAQTAGDNGTNLTMYKSLPSASVTPAQKQFVCSGSSVTLSAPLGTGYLYQWKKDNVNISGSVARTYVANTGGLFSCDISNVCGTVHSNVVSLTVLPSVPELYITYKGPLTINSGDSVELSCNILDSNFIYRWYRNSTLLNPVKSTMTYMAKISGSYSLKIGDPVYDCFQTSYALNIYVRNTTAVKETYSAQSYLKVQPNPFSNHVSISFSIQDRQNFSVKIVDLAGRLVKTIASDIHGGGNFEYNWMADDQDGNPINQGIYFLKLEGKSFYQTEKLILVR